MNFDKEAKDFITKLGFGTRLKVQKDKTGIPENSISSRICEQGL